MIMYDREWYLFIFEIEFFIASENFNFERNIDCVLEFIFFFFV